jgi:hypothetical protein
MNDVRDWLKAEDPVVSEPPLSAVDAQRMRRAVVSAGESYQPSFGDWARGSWAVATVFVALTIAVSVSRWSKPWEDLRPANDAPITAQPEAGVRRQLQLIAPGGTRVIWIFNDEFNP